MAKKKTRTHEVRMPTKDENFVGTISPLEIFLGRRRSGGRAGQVMKSGKEYNRAREKRARNTEDR